LWPTCFEIGHRCPKASVVHHHVTLAWVTSTAEAPLGTIPMLLGALPRSSAALLGILPLSFGILLMKLRLPADN
jgi:hypothetical protein